jgi:hypothetical protein
MVAHKELPLPVFQGQILFFQQSPLLAVVVVALILMLLPVETLEMVGQVVGLLQHQVPNQAEPEIRPLFLLHKEIMVQLATHPLALVLVVEVEQAKLGFKPPQVQQTQMAGMVGMVQRLRFLVPRSLMLEVEVEVLEQLDLQILVGWVVPVVEVMEGREI